MIFKSLLIPLVMATCLISPMNESRSIQSDSSEIHMSIDKRLLLQGEEATIKVYNHSEDKIQWFVNDVLQEGKEDSTFVFSSNTIGKYRIFATTNNQIIGIKELEVVSSELNQLTSYGYMADKVSEENFDTYGSTDPLIGIANSTAFKITNTDNNGYLESVASNWGGSPWYATNVGSYNLVDNYEISFDVMYPENVYGIGGFQIGGAVNGADFEIGCFELASNGFSRLYANGPNGQLYNSDTVATGGTNNNCSIKNGEWFNYRMMKIGSEFYIYINQNLIIHRTIDFTWTPLKGICFVQFLVDNTTGIRYDNLKVQGIEVGSNVQNPIVDKELESLDLELTSLKVEQGDAVAAKAILTPFNASVSQLDWYINDEFAESTSSLIYNIPCLEEGNIKIQVKSGEVMSKPKLIEVTPYQDIELLDTSNWKPVREETFEYWSDGSSWGANNPDVLKSDGDGHIEHKPGQPYSKCGMFFDIGTGTFPGNYVLSYDFKFKENSVGRINWILSGFFNSQSIGKVYVEKTLNGASVGLCDESGKDLMSSKSVSYGGQNIDLSTSIAYDEWHNLRFYKVENVVALYVDDILVCQNKLSGIIDTSVQYCIIVTEFFNQATAGCYLDNVALLTATAESDKIEVVTITASKQEVLVGETVYFVANTFPNDIECSQVQWYVNDQKVEGANLLDFSFTPTEGGSYQIHCVVDEIVSNKKEIQVKGNETTDKGNPVLWISLSLGGVLIIGGIVLFIIFKKKRG